MSYFSKLGRDSDQPIRYFVMKSIHENNDKLWKTLWETSPKMKTLQKSLQNKMSLKMADYKLSRLASKIIQSKRRFLKNYCNLFPYQVVKIVRLELRALQNMLKKNSRYLKLVTDPTDRHRVSLEVS